MTEPQTDVPLHLRGVTPTRAFRLTDEADFRWLADYFSGYHGVGGLRAAVAESRNATLDEVVRVVEGLPLPPMYFDGPPTWTDGTDAMRADVLDAVKALRG